MITRPAVHTAKQPNSGPTLGAISVTDNPRQPQIKLWGDRTKRVKLAGVGRRTVWLATVRAPDALGDRAFGDGAGAELISLVVQDGVPAAGNPAPAALLGPVMDGNERISTKSIAIPETSVS